MPVLRFIRRLGLAPSPPAPAPAAAPEPTQAQQAHPPTVPGLEVLELKWSDWETVNNAQRLTPWR
ncbi:hypothetical protein ACG0Z6_00055 [Roseateles sp. BYS180W]|uniref:Uncharacterized protein n=1 Tax=Roseateles rivi TaxID=3299028 RepID=A0ABW7FQM3_9BURK